MNDEALEAYAEAVSNHIMEGDDRDTNAEFVEFLYNNANIRVLDKLLTTACFYRFGLSDEEKEHIRKMRECFIELKVKAFEEEYWKEKQGY